MTKERLLLVALFFALVICPANAAAQSSSSPAESGPSSGAQTASETAAISGSAPRNVTAYTLPPALYRKARNLGRINFYSDLLGFVYGLALLWLILRWKFAPRYRDWAERFSSNRLLQAIVFSPLVILTIAVLRLPMDLFDHSVLRAYGISIEGWGAWAWDWTKAMFVLILAGSILVWILYEVIRRSPRRWWLFFWLISLPILVFLLFVEPLVLEPMFFQFAPLSQKDPELVAQIERVVERAGMVIPPSRMFWMKASEKTPTMNAYVSGLGASQRVVVWDTDLAKETTPEIVSDFGHEMGHYVLGHVWKGFLFNAAAEFVLLYLGFRSIRWVLARWGAGWNIRGLDDWASLPALLLVLLVFNFLSNPISSVFSRHIEHQADVYGLEVTHGLIPNAGQAAADALQVEGEAGLDDPDPNPVDVFLFYDHPPISGRIQFCLHYDPWSKGHHPEFVK
jgi:Zn-dependent protease with chaperone function